ncbi:Rod shape-determining protein MreC [Coxiella-like endosymbiont]|nr:Rod shape-determining protein MreC [Coxiella-like endosymbiont]
MSGLRALIYISLSIVLILLDQKTFFFHKIRANLSLVVFPIQYLVNTPIKTIHWIATNITTQQQLMADNARLRAHEWLLESKLQKLLALERENAQLRELLKSTSRIHGLGLLVAQLLAVNLDPNLQQVVVDKGTQSHIYVGQPVLDAYGIIGQVVDVSLLTSNVMLISDPKNAVPVQDYRNGTRAIAVGLGSSDKLMLINVPDTSDIKKGDLFISSGLGLRYPAGYPVGVVSELIHNPVKRFARIILQPSAHLDQSQQVLMVWPDKTSLNNTIRKNLLSSSMSPKENGKL